MLVAPRPPQGEDAPRQTGKAKTNKFQILLPVTVTTAGEELEGLKKSETQTQHEDEVVDGVGDAGADGGDGGQGRGSQEETRRHLWSLLLQVSHLVGV